MSLRTHGFSAVVEVKVNCSSYEQERALGKWLGAVLMISPKGEAGLIIL